MAQQSEVHERTTALFQNEWQTYRKIVDNNYLFHREAYGCLHDFLLSHGRPFRFLDIACGDAGASAGALADTAVTAYHGVDFSRAALDLAAEALAPLNCIVTLEEADFVAAFQGSEDVADIAWIGLSLHHLQTAAKREFMTDIRRVVGVEGCLLIYEDAGPDGDTREAWMQRWNLQRPGWTAFSDAEWDAVTTHVHAADYPETVSSWTALGHDVGFSRVEQHYTTPTDLFRVFSFAA